MCLSGPKTPAPPPPPKPAPKPPTRVSQEVVAARDDERRRANMRMGQGGTDRSGPSVNDPSNRANTGKRTLLGGDPSEPIEYS